MRFSELWHWRGTIDRGPYALIGFVGFALKHGLDRLLATFVYDRPWGIFNYWIPPSEAVHFASLREKDAEFLVAMVALSLPFIWVGVGLTLRRLRSAGLPTWLILFFFAPFVNGLFLIVMAVLPPRISEGRQPEVTVSRSFPWLARVIPNHPFGSAAMGVLATSMLGVPLTMFSTQVLINYGWGLFVALPFVLGFVSVMIYSYHGPRSLGFCLWVSMLSALFAGAMLLAVALEGIICLVMILPLALPLAAFGGFLGYVTQRGSGGRIDTSQALPALILALPGLMLFEHAALPDPPTFEVKTAIEINAPPEAVWRKVVAFSELPEPEDWLFRLGLAYPMRATIQGEGAGAERHCVFSTGSFVEPIEVWDEPRLLKFSVTSNPPPMEEWTPYRAVHPPHLDNFLVSNGGQFLLSALPGGRTRLEGTTWYRHSMWPAPYWQLWSDEIIHRIHLRVLRHIKAGAEDPA